MGVKVGVIGFLLSRFIDDRLWRKIVVSVGLLLGLLISGGCGGGNGGRDEQGESPEKNAVEQSAVEESAVIIETPAIEGPALEEEQNRPFSVVVDLAKEYRVDALSRRTLRVQLDDPDGDAQITWRQTSGQPLWVNAPTGFEISVLMPADEGIEQQFQLEALIDDGVHQTELTTKIIVPTVVKTIIDYWQESNEEVQAGLVAYDEGHSDMIASVDTLDGRGLWTAEEGRFDIQLTSPSDTYFVLDEWFSMNLYGPRSGENVNDLFEYDEQTQKLELKAGSLDQWLALLSTGFNELRIIGKDNQGDSVAPIIQFRYGFGSISGVLTLPESSSTVSLENQKIGIRGDRTRLTYQAEIDGNNQFSISGLPADTYRLQFYSEDGWVSMGSARITLSKKDSVVELPLYDIGVKRGAKHQHSGNKVDNPTVNNKEENTDLAQVSEAPALPFFPPPSSREQGAGQSKQSDARLDAEQASSGEIFLGSAMVSGQTEDRMILSDELLTVPDSINRIKIVASIASDEHPHWISLDRNYNDNWQFYYRAGDRERSRSGNVNSTHSARKEIFFQEYFVFDEEASNNRTVSMLVGSANIGDSSLGTQVKVSVYGYTDNPSYMSVSRFKHHDGLGEGSNGRWYIGVSSQTTRDWVAHLEFAPATLSSINGECEYVTPDYQIPLLIKDLAVNKPGVATVRFGFSNVNAPEPTETHGTVDCFWSGIDANGEQVLLAYPKSMEMASDTFDLIPLYQVNVAASQRFSLRDTGGDNWAGYGLTQFYDEYQFIFNDMSREHGGCFFKDKYYTKYNMPNVICKELERDHWTHRQGTSIDVRYPVSTMNRPNGGLLRSKLAAAFDDPDTALEVEQWVLELRRNLQALAERAEVRLIYFSDKNWLRNLILSGVDEKNRSIGSLTEWINRSKKLVPHAKHDGHIHIELETH